MTRDVHLLTFTSLYPSIARPRHGIFIESRLQGLLQRGGLRAHVVAPVPWFPFTGSRWGEYGRMARTPHRELRNGIEVRYPRYLSLPYVGFSIKPDVMARAGLRAVESLLREGEAIDLIDAHYLYPDGVAAAAVALRIGRPFLLSARGTDVNVIAQMPDPWRRISEAIEASSGVIAVSAALKTSLVSLGIPADRVTVLRNGVDPTLFYPEDRVAARKELGLPDGEAQIVVSVGNLVPEKRHELALGGGHRHRRAAHCLCRSGSRANPARANGARPERSEPGVVLRRDAPGQVAPGLFGCQRAGSRFRTGRVAQHPARGRRVRYPGRRVPGRR